MKHSYSALFAILAIAIIFSSEVNKSISQTTNIDINVNKTTSDTLTVSDIVNVLVSFGQEGWTRTWTGENMALSSSAYSYQTISKVDESSVRIAIGLDSHISGMEGYSYETFKIVKPFLKYTLIFDGEERPGKHDIRTCEIEIEIISKTNVKINVALYYPNFFGETTKYGTEDCIKK